MNKYFRIGQYEFGIDSAWWWGTAYGCCHVYCYGWFFITKLSPECYEESRKNPQDGDDK